MGARGSGVRALCVKEVRESYAWQNTFTSDAYFQDYNCNKGWVDGVS